MTAFDIFISYSHKDSTIVESLVSLIRAVGPSAFRDADCITPGSEWRIAVDEALESASIVLVFWSRFSAISRDVEAEYLRAIALNKKLIPVLIDDTPVPQALSRFQWVDLRGLEQDPTGYWRYVGLHPGWSVRIAKAVVQAVDREAIELAHKPFGGKL